MTASPRKREVFANPFFVVLLATSVGFVLTVLAYLISSSVLAPESGHQPASAHSLAAAVWLDRNAPWALAVEIGIMLTSGVVAMATDPWFSSRSKPRPPA